MKPGIDHLESGVPERTGHNPCSPVVTVQARLGYEDPNLSVHKKMSVKGSSVTVTLVFFWGNVIHCDHTG
jgi:hypothetical protein